MFLGLIVEESADDKERNQLLINNSEKQTYSLTCILKTDLVSVLRQGNIGYQNNVRSGEGKFF